ncbi:MAG: SDR family oxidoreductase [Lewinellaceae bacterium]|nr:SDR family oxidoreductase [Saprospiraceae bacterium]MCB9314109.1 SDR family oxidoreductase [Lewinellaceae bacterium]HRW76150.1 SDR family oxidoreductase [Saprospiraceae bacterium]
MNDHTRYVVITGITKGIGYAIARRFAQEGMGLIGCSRHAGDLEAMKDELDVLHPDLPVHLIPTDLSVPHEVDTFAQYVQSITEAPAVLVNNAGIFQPGGILDEQPGVLERTMQINLYSAYHLTRHLVPGMVRQGNGHIFNLCSVASLQAYAGGSTYAITKFAMLGFSRSLRAELKDTGLRVTSLIPGATWSDSWSGADLPPDRLMDAEDIAALVWTSFSLRSPAVVEEILIRPQLGDL